MIVYSSFADEVLAALPDPDQPDITTKQLLEKMGLPFDNNWRSRISRTLAALRKRNMVHRRPIEKTAANAWRKA